MFIGVWLSLVERVVRDDEVASSNLVTPTKKKRQFSFRRLPFLFVLFFVLLSSLKLSFSEKRYNFAKGRIEFY